MRPRPDDPLRPGALPRCQLPQPAPAVNVHRRARRRPSTLPPRRACQGLGRGAGAVCCGGRWPPPLYPAGRAVHRQPAHGSGAGGHGRSRLRRLAQGGVLLSCLDPWGVSWSGIERSSRAGRGEYGPSSSAERGATPAAPKPAQRKGLFIGCPGHFGRCCRGPAETGADAAAGPEQGAHPSPSVSPQARQPCLPPHPLTRPH